MVVLFTDLRDGDAKNLIFFVLSGFITRSILPASLLISTHIASRAGWLLAITKISKYEEKKTNKIQQLDVYY